MAKTDSTEKIVCTCTGVTCGRIREAVEAGAVSLAEVQEATGAGTVCGSCLEEVEALVRHYTGQRDTP